MSIRNRLFNVGCAVSAFAVTALPVLAEGEADVPAYVDTIDDVKGAILDFLDDMKDPIGAIIIAGLALWLIPQVVRLLKRAFGAGKGR